MGLIKAVVGAAGGVMADQWKEFFYCDAIPVDTLMVRGKVKTTSRSSNTSGYSNVISNGSGVVVAPGQCAIIAEQGRVVEICAEPGEYTYRNDIAPTLFTGSLGANIKNTFAQIGKRFTYGGDAPVDQRVYYFNIKEIIDNKFGTANPIPFRVVDKNVGLDIDVSVRCNGTYSYKLDDPILFYTNVCGNVVNEYKREQIEGQLKTEFISALQPALGKLSAMEIRPSGIPGHVEELCDALNAALSKKWGELRGIKIVNVAMNPVTLPKEDDEMIKDIQRRAVNRNPGMAGATLIEAQADAMKAAASNANGAMNGFFGLGMAQQAAGNINAQQFFQMDQQAQQQAQFAQQQARPAQAPSAGQGWKCSCGAVNTGKFCVECGKPMPADDSWTCSCGTLNKGKFCMNCGQPKPKAAASYRCNKCGWVPSDPQNPPKFCPECGDVFDVNDMQ